MSIPPQAKLVAAATSNLCESANLMVQGQAEEDKLIVAAKAVAASTAQLLIACQVKADARSESNKRLQVRRIYCVTSTSVLVENGSFQQNHLFFFTVHHLS